MNENGSEMKVECSTCVQLLERRSTCRRWSERKELDTFRHDVDVDVERKQAQAIASLPDSITHYYAYSNEDITVISLRLPVP